jgi:hypothetical protein
MFTTMDQIQQLSDERYRLWLKAGRESLSDREYWRLQEITRQLDKLWADYRRQNTSDRPGRNVPEPEPMRELVEMF